MTQPEKNKIECPHCQQKLLKWACPIESKWCSEYMYICFNDDCSFFVEGWDWMLENYNVKASYRYRYNPFTGETGSLPVYSKDAGRESIIP